MNNLILTAPQAAELHTTGRLTGYREKCEWQPPKGASVFEIDDWDAYWKVHYCLIADPEVELNDVQKLTPPRDRETTYAVKEPCELFPDEDWDGELGILIAYEATGRDENDEYLCERIQAPDKETYERVTNGYINVEYSAETCPDWAVRQHARITDIKLIIESGELWWDFGDLEKVG